MDVHSNKLSRMYFKLVLVALFWGSTFIAGRVLAQDVPPFTAAFLRFLLASVCLVLFMKKEFFKLPKLDYTQILLLVVLAFTGIAGYNFFFFSGLKIIPASRASIIVAGTPVMVALFSAFIFKEKFTLIKLLGFLLSVTGAIMVISKGNPALVFQGKVGSGELLILGCVILWTIFTLAGKPAMEDLSPLMVITYACIIGTLILVFPAYAEGSFQSIPSYGLDIWLSIFALGFFGTALGFTWFYEAIDSIGPAKSGVFINFVPVFATAMAIIILHEQVSFSFIIGAILVISGVYLINRRNAAGNID